MSDDLISEFLVESYENLDHLDQALVELEKDPRDAGNLASIFRTIHTIKGTCGFLGFSKLESITHVGENLLSRLRDGALLLNEDITTGLLALVDAVRALLTAIEHTGVENDTDYSELVALLTRLNAVEAPAAASTEPVIAAKASRVAGAEPVEAEPAGLVDGLAGGRCDAPATIERVVADERRVSDDRRSGEERRSGDDRRAGVADTSLRVDVGLLDKLMTLVGELVLARNQILQFTSTQRDSGFIGATQRLNLVASELQEGVMKTRMQPIDNVWSKFPRVVRDLAVVCSKRVRIEMIGRETDLDKTIIEAVKDPLTHIVRNSVDHGIEAPDQRIARGKDPEGVITLKAFHEGGQINIEISDDGAGIDPDKLRRKAVDRGFVTAEAAGRLSDREALRLIFLPGFSTAETISNVSGRGVGMDVVKTNIERIGGTVDITSTMGTGTTLRIKIPLTLAIIPALMVTTGRERFAIPQVNLVELVRLEGNQAPAGIERIQGATFYRLRGNLLPVAYLHKELGLQSTGDPDITNIVVLKADGRLFGLVVDVINDTEEIVVKPLGKVFKNVPVFAGATIMGDGHVALILDVFGLAQRASVVSQTRRKSESDDDKVSRRSADNVGTWLLFAAGERERLAIPLERVDRLEEFSPNLVERSAGREVVQYRGEIMPLIALGGQAAAGTGPRQAIVFSHAGRRIGLSVDRILDIASEAVAVDRSTREPGLTGAAVIQQRVTDLVDLDALVQATLSPARSDSAPRRL
jgi:two-component system, chemotaxis family, sensor kinase CheA